jgi:hypothetical protein
VSEHCRACNAPIVFALSRNGKPSPITLEPSDGGNVLLFRVGDETRYAVATPEVKEWAQAQGVPLRLNHFADCPDAARFKR